MLTRDEIGQLWKRWYKPIRQWLSHTTNQQVKGGTAIDDMAQEVFVRLLKYRTTAELPPVENIQGYLFRIASNVRNEFLERAVVRKMHDVALLEELVEDEEAQPDRAREAEDMDEAVARCLQQLPPRARRLVMLHIHEGLTYKQIAAREGYTYRMVLRTLTGAYTELRRRTADYCRDAPLSERVKTTMRIERERADERQRREHERQRELFERRAAKQEERTRRTAMLAALEAHGFVVSRAAKSLGMPLSTMHIRLRKYVPELAALRLKHATNRRVEMLRTFETHRYSYDATARALRVDDHWLKRELRTAYPDIEERKAAWKAQRRAEVLKNKQQLEQQRRKDQTAAARASLAAARATDAAMHTCTVVVSGVYQHAMIRALESTNYRLTDAAKLLGITEPKARHILPRLVPDFAERKARARARQGLQLLKALVRNRFSLVRTAAALGYSTHSGFLNYTRSVLPSYDDLRAKYMRKHSMGRCGGHIETPEEHRERLERARLNRSAGTRRYNSLRWGSAEHRHAQVKARLQRLEAQRAKLAALHDKEKADMRKAIISASACLMKLAPAERQTSELQAAITALKQNYRSMRKRQVDERRTINEAITHQRQRIPDRDKVFRLTEQRAEREAAGHARKLEVLDACGGNALQASVILNMHVGYVRKWKRENWKPPEQREQDEPQSVANTG